MKNKYTSRKFIAALTGMIAGALMILSGNVTQGTAAIVSSVAVYCIAEGIIDAKSLKIMAEIASDDSGKNERGNENDILL